MNITLTGPVSITLKPDTLAFILDLIAKNTSYNVGKQILEQEIFPQLEKKDEPDPG